MATSIIQLDPAIPVLVLRPDGWHKAHAHGWMDYGIEDDLYWICISDTDGSPWILPNKFIRGQTNLTIGRRVNIPSSEPEKPTS